jgi:hypothetical protein
MLSDLQAHTAAIALSQAFQPSILLEYPKDIAEVLRRCSEPEARQRHLQERLGDDQESAGALRRNSEAACAAPKREARNFLDGCAGLRDCYRSSVWHFIHGECDEPCC